jgi:hypothetical protein
MSLSSALNTLDIVLHPSSIADRISEVFKFARVDMEEEQWMLLWPFEGMAAVASPS